MTAAVKQQDTERHADVNSAAVLSLARHRRLTTLRSAPPHSVSLRDGELVVYRRSRSLLYQSAACWLTALLGETDNRQGRTGTRRWACVSSGIAQTR